MLRQHFLHGVLVRLAHSVWVTAWVTASHMPLPEHPRLMMALVGPVIGLVSGLVLGLLAVIVHKFVSGGTRG